MKKKVLFAGILAIIAVVGAFIGYNLLKPSVFNLSKKAVKNLNKVHSLEADLNMDYKGNVTGSLLSTDVALAMDFDVQAVTEPAVIHSNGTIGIVASILSYEIPVEIYSQLEDGTLTAYTNPNGMMWIKSQKEGLEGPPEETNSLTGLAVLQKIVNGEIKAELAEETEEIGGKETYRIDAKVGGETLGQLINAYGDLTGEGSILPENVDLSGADAEIVFYIYKDSKLPACVKLDCTAAGDVLIGSKLEENNMVGKTDQFVITVLIKDYNTIDELGIPEEVKQAAVEQEDLGVLGDLFNF